MTDGRGRRLREADAFKLAAICSLRGQKRCVCVVLANEVDCGPKEFSSAGGEMTMRLVLFAASISIQ